MDDAIEGFRNAFFSGEINRMSGSGGEVLLKAPENRGKGRDTRIEVGDRLVGIGVTQYIESMERPPGPDNMVVAGEGGPSKLAARGFVAVSRKDVADGVEFRFAAMAGREYAELLSELSGGFSKIEADTIPEGTMILSFIVVKPRYTLRSMRGSPQTNWRAVLSGKRHWNVGISKKSDFWYAKFPTDDVSAVPAMPPWARVGQIRFGLSLLPGSRGTMNLEPLATNHPDGQETLHDFCLDGHVAGTRGLNTGFYIGLRTGILCKPLK